MIGGYSHRNKTFGGWCDFLTSCRKVMTSSPPASYSGPAFEAAGGIASGAGDITPSLPANTSENWILICVAETDSGESIDPVQDMPAGWAHVTGSPVSNISGALLQHTTLNVIWKRAGVGETDPTITEISGARVHTVARIMGFSGCITTGNPWDITDTATADSTTTHSIPGGTTTVANCLIVALLASTRNVTSTTNMSSWANADLENVTEQLDNTVQIGSGNGGGFGAATGEKITAGLFGATTVTSSTATNGAYLMLALKPPA